MKGRSIKMKIKYCKNCPHYTGQIEHGWNEYWGECKKNKNTLFCFDDTPCLQDLNTLREVYYKNKIKIAELQQTQIDLPILKERLVIRGRTIDKYKEMLQIACKHIPKEQYKKYWKEQANYLLNYGKDTKNTTKQQNK